MKQSTKDRIEGKFVELKGDIKVEVGQITNNPRLKAEGRAEKIAGRVQQKMGQIKRVLEK